MSAVSFNRWTSSIILLSVLAGSAAAAHFTISPHGNAGSMTVLIDTAIHPSIGGMTLGSGDEVAVFDSLDSCYGAGRWDSLTNLTISVFVNDPQFSPAKNGMAVGERLHFKVWDSSASLQLPAAATFYPVGVPAPAPIFMPPFSDSTFAVNGLSILSSLSAIPPPAAPPLASPTNNAQSQPLAPALSWGTSALAASYIVQVSLSSAFDATILNQTGATLSGATASGLANGTTYFWRAGASNAAGTTWSGVWSFTTVIAVPATPVLASPTSGALGRATSLTLGWNSAARAASYEIEISLSSAFATTVFDQSGGTLLSAAASGLANATTFFWRVNAANAGGPGAWSGVWSFTTIVAAPLLAQPTNGAINQPTSCTLGWGSTTLATSYAVQVSSTSVFASTVFYQSGASMTSATASGLAGSTNYYWRVSASNAGGASWSDVWSFTTVISAPATPGLVLPATGATGQPTTLALSWNSSSRAATYEVQVSSSYSFSNTCFDQSGTTQTSATVSDLAIYTTYYWRVSASNAGGKSAWSSSWSFTTVLAAPLLASPTNGAANLATTLTLSWSASAHAHNYEVQVSLSSVFASTILDQSGSNLTSTTVSGLSNSTTYFWRANASRTGSLNWSDTWSFTTIVAPSASPLLATPSNGAPNQALSLTLAWNTSARAAAYDVQVSLSSTFSATVLNQSGATLTGVTLDNLVNGTTYYWRVNASNAGGTTWSAVWSFTTVVAAPATPLLASPTNGAADQPYSLVLKWGSSARAGWYEMQVSTSSAFADAFFEQSGSTLTSASMAGLADGETFYWRVIASNAGGSSAWSDVWSFSIIAGGVARTIPIAAGWNMKSLNIRPPDSTTSALFSTRTGSITDPKGFLMVKDVFGDTYIPSLGIDNISAFTVGLGYQIYSDSADTMRLLGQPVAIASTPILLPQADWSIIAFLPQANMPAATVFSGIIDNVVLVKDNGGAVYMPGLFDNLDTMRIGEGYYVYTTVAATFTYPPAAKVTASCKPTLRLPPPRHFAKHRITGNNATLVAKRIGFGAAVAPDNCEVGAFDAAGNLVGAGSVENGMTAFAVWGDDPQTKAKDGCAIAEKLTFRLWTNGLEYPLKPSAGDQPAYGINAILRTTLAVPAGARVTSFALSRVYPNPFRGSVRIAFEVPTLQGASAEDVEIGVFDMKGSLVQTIVKSRYAPGRYEASWNGSRNTSLLSGSNMYIVRMKAEGFDQREKLIELR